MENFRIEKLIGATKDNEIVFANIEVMHRNGYPEFTASFNTVMPITEDDVESAEEYYRMLLDDCYDDAQKYKMCVDYNCTPDELAEHLVDANGENIQDIRDCSLYSEIINVNGTDYYFESGSCGQHDTRGDMQIYVNKKAYDKIHKLWDEFHLKEITEETYNEIQNAISMLLEDEEAEQNWIADFIRNIE